MSEEMKKAGEVGLRQAVGREREHPGLLCVEETHCNWSLAPCETWTNLKDDPTRAPPDFPHQKISRKLLLLSIKGCSFIQGYAGSEKATFKLEATTLSGKARFPSGGARLRRKKVHP